MANFMSMPPRGVDPQALAQALMQMSQQPGDQVHVRPAQWDASQYSQALHQLGTPAAATGKSGGQRAAGAGMGALQGASTGSMFGPWGTAIGAIAGALYGGLS